MGILRDKLHDIGRPQPDIQPVDQFGHAALRRISGIFGIKLPFGQRLGPGNGKGDCIEPEAGIKRIAERIDPFAHQPHDRCGIP